MEGLINIEDHNKKVEEIEKKKEAITEAANCGKKALDSQKPKVIKNLKIGNYSVRPTIRSDGSFGSHSEIVIMGCILPYNLSVGSLQSLAACIIKAFGQIPQELIDTVEVE